MALSRSFVIKERPCLTSFGSSEAQREMFLGKGAESVLVSSIKVSGSNGQFHLLRLTTAPSSKV